MYLHFIWHFFVVVINNFELMHMQTNVALVIYSFKLYLIYLINIIVNAIKYV